MDKQEDIAAVSSATLATREAQVDHGNYTASTSMVPAVTEAKVEPREA
jgi:hypothetical protein